MIGENIKNLRTKKGMTQKDLADKLFVTPQAVSRWENNIVEPNLAAIAEMSKIFDVSTNVILGVEDSNDINNNESSIDREAVAQPQRQVLAVCEKCNKLIYDPEDICRENYGTNKQILCRECHDAINKQIEINKKSVARKCRIKSFIIGGIVGGIALVLNIFAMATAEKGELDALTVMLMILFPILLFTFTSCMCLKNNFIEDMMSWAATFGFVKMPGLIFELSLNGILWLLTVKLLLWILTFVLSAVALVLTFIVALPISLFAYPYALVKSYRHPEDTIA